jgi:glycerol-3-phosphate dehydrogenase
MNVLMRECGSLVCAWPWDEDFDGIDVEKKTEDGDSSQYEQLMRVLRESLYAGDLNACYVDSNSVSELEPSLYLNKMQRCGGYSRRNCG